MKSTGGSEYFYLDGAIINNLKSDFGVFLVDFAFSKAII